jgi:hypothetical protein
LTIAEDQFVEDHRHLALPVLPQCTTRLQRSASTVNRRANCLPPKKLSQFVEQEIGVTPERMAACNNDSEMKFCWPTALSRFRL